MTTKTRLAKLESQAPRGALAVCWPDTPDLVTIDGKVISRDEFYRRHPNGVIIAVEYADPEPPRPRVG